MKMKIEKIRDIEFFNRESETEEIVNILKFNPRLITFIYGPINSGKTSLIINLIENLPEDYVVFYINLRGKFISNYNDFVESLFEINREHKKNKNTISEFTKEFLAGAGKYYGIPLPENLLNVVFKDNEPKNVFEYIITVMEELKRNKRQPILVIDELQVIGDLKIDDYLIYKIFNFFIRLTKELHLCHVFALSSDSLFIEKVYSEAMLQERCEYLIIDEFNEQTTKKFLGNHGFNDEEQDMVWQYAGGKPTHLITSIRAKISKTALEETLLRILMIRKGEIQTMLNRVKQLGDKVIIGDGTHKVDYNLLTGTLNKFRERSYINTMEVDEITKTYLVKKNLLFVDPVNDIIKPQSKIDLLAIREILGELNTTD